MILTLTGGSLRFPAGDGNNVAAAIYGGDHRFRVNRFAVSIPKWGGEGGEGENRLSRGCLLSTVFLMPRAKRMYGRVNVAVSERTLIATVIP